VTRRAVITGAGAVSPFGAGGPSASGVPGSGAAALIEAVLSGRTAVAEVGAPDEGCGGRGRVCAALVRDPLEPGPFPATAWRRLDRVSRMAALAAREALAAAGLRQAAAIGAGAPDPASGPRPAGDPGAEVGIVLGTMTAGAVPLGEYLRGLWSEGPEAVSPMLFPFTVPNAPAAQCAILLGLRGPNLTVCRMEASGLGAIAEAAAIVGSGAAEILLAGGADEVVPEFHAAWRSLRMTARGGAAAFRGPFDAAASGFAPGEGAYLVVVEAEEIARRRGAPVLAAIDATAEVHHAVPPHRWPEPPADRPEATAAAEALGRWSVPPAGLGYVMTAASGSPRLDAAAARAVAAALGGHGAPGGDAASRKPASPGRAAGRVPVTSVKGAIGESGAASACGALLAACSIRDGFIPPIAALRTPAPAVGLRLVRVAAKRPVAAVLAHAFGSGGSDVALLLGRCD
jgi:3-oxoacyl-[acyl-carrier-protein] synthase II